MSKEMQEQMDVSSFFARHEENLILLAVALRNNGNLDDTLKDMADKYRLSADEIAYAAKVACSCKFVTALEYPTLLDYGKIVNFIDYRMNGNRFIQLFFDTYDNLLESRDFPIEEILDAFADDYRTYCAEKLDKTLSFTEALDNISQEHSFFVSDSMISTLYDNQLVSDDDN